MPLLSATFRQLWTTYMGLALSNSALLLSAKSCGRSAGMVLLIENRCGTRAWW